MEDLREDTEGLVPSTPLAVPEQGTSPTPRLRRLGAATSALVAGALFSGGCIGLSFERSGGPCPDAVERHTYQREFGGRTETHIFEKRVANGWIYYYVDGQQVSEMDYRMKLMMAKPF